MALSLTTVPNMFAMSGVIKQGYPQRRGTLDGLSAECVYELPFTAIATYPEGLLGKVASSSATDVVLHMPHACPNVPDALCTEIAWQPVGRNTGHVAPHHAVYDHIELTAHYETAPDDPIELLVEERISPAVEFLTLPNNQLYWTAGSVDPLAEVETPSKMISMWEWEYTIRRLPEACLPANIDDHLGKINTVAMVSHKFGITWPISTVLYGDVRIDDGVTQWGGRTYNIAYKFLVKEYSWQLFYRSSYQTPQIVRRPLALGVFSAYETANLTDLIFV